jgi:hypothetical protein
MREGVFSQRTGARTLFVPVCWANKWLAGVDETTKYELPIPAPSVQQPSPKIRKRDRDRAERIAAAGGPSPTLREKAVALVESLGEARTRDLTDIGVPRCYLGKMCDEGLLIKVAYGRYRVGRRMAA